MKIAILGAGNGGCAVATDLSLKGHQVSLLKTSNSMHNENYDYLVETKGLISLFEDGRTRTTRLYQVSKDLSLLAEAEVVIIYVQTNYHEALIQRVAPYFKEGQIVIINPGYFSTAYMLKYCDCAGLTIVEAESSFIDCRIAEPGIVKVGFRNVRNPVGVYPKQNLEKVRSKLDALDCRLVYLDSLLEASLHNPNMIVHTVGAVMSIPRIEKTQGDYCMYHEVFTPSVWRILEQLDKEKMDVLEALGCKRMPYVEACKYRNSLDDTRDGKEVFFWYAAMPTRAKGPIVVDSRYIAEDVPQGLVMLESLGKKLNVATPVTFSLIELASYALGRDLRKEGRTLEGLGEENIKKILDDCLI
ncbi:NAD/NADP octopine/nopaline dehydrogenase family protein [Butyricimonas hominis]|jgi:NAD/NADP octopine/nopaline dehydrogenase|uniref:2-dehydropantoate 2-reductase n=1 Tax=Butyricimonas hominis TaxID=2763032 RepID=A0ABR7D3B2_9BACT|nr:NAD/NADP octopine/nopaline dehydrogenase family protein [Butyricimonas hominis]MBC5622417.1 NAD/NADP octopine/nopaline dehydrogenase family protein [Butyricimonas hominis]